MRRLVVIIVILLALPLSAHQGLHEQIEDVTLAIAREPRNGALYLKRAELHRLHHGWQEAESDFERARKLDPDLYGVDLAWGRMLFDAGRAPDALVPLQRYVKIAPQDPMGHVALARTLMQVGRASDAIVAFERALSGRPDPAVALDYAAALVAGRCREDALRYLDSLEPLVTYQLAAIDLELQAGNFENALRRVEAAEVNAPRKDEWLERRGDILMKMGRAEEARAAYRAALDALSTLPPERRRTRAMTAMKRCLLAALD